MVQQKGRQLVYISTIILILLVAACSSLKKAKPILPNDEYERLLLGNIMADYVGNNNCLSACHFHDKIKIDFEGSTMGAQLQKDAGMPVVDCESCHGPGSLAIEGITPEKVEADRKQGMQTACNYKTLIDLNNLPAGAKSLICLKCHTANATFNIHNWNASIHALSDVSCSDCHPVHSGPDLITKPRDVYQMCLSCHQEIRAEFMLPSHHPITEHKIFCSDCHASHGNSNPGMLPGITEKETCARCHADKAGPFLFEHGDVTEQCSNCHSPHGSINEHLLKLREPFLCKQCHEPHRIASGGISSSAESKGAFHTRCTDCHPGIHGTDIPGATASGRFTQ